MRKILAFLVLSLASLSALAGTANLSWTAPTTRTDGSALTGAVTCQGLSRHVCGSRRERHDGTRDVTAGTTYTDASAPAGTQLRRECGGFGWLESAKTAAVSVVIPSAPPSPPTGLSVVAVIAGTNLSPCSALDDKGRRQQFAGLDRSGRDVYGAGAVHLPRRLIPAHRVERRGRVVLRPTSGRGGVQGGS